MSIRERLSGNEAAATAMKQINPDVVAAFPITPSTEIPQYFSTFVDNGLVDTEFVAVESEHSAMSACIGAEAAGARAMTATSANGLSLMWEMIYIASSLRLPIVMSLVNRAVSGPLNIHNDHSDAMGVRDAGWIMLFSENNQEAYDNLLMAHKIAENKNGNPVGFMGVDDKRLEMLFVLDKYRGQGIGKQLLQYGIENYSINELTVNEQNPRAKGFYEHMGFHVYKRDEFDEHGNPYPILWMKRSQEA